MGKFLKKYKVVLHYYHSPHLNQIYDGFAKLRKSGVCDIQYIPSKEGIGRKPLLYAEINGVRVLYDCLDGLCWQDNFNQQENINYFATHDFNVDYYFKRSYSKQLESFVNNRFEYLPLGLNYDIYPEYMPFCIERMKQALLRTKIGVKWKGDKLFFMSQEFEQEPIVHPNGRILFLVRLWNPESISDLCLREERLRINKMRIEAIRKCREKFGEQFFGGIQVDEYSINNCPKELLMPNTITNREHYLRLMHSSNICIATTGLYDSIGWKFAEYVAASRAILSEPLNYMLPGTFIEGDNYLTFTNPDELIEKISILLQDTDRLKRMMEYNKEYYNQCLRPDKLVLNSLKKVCR